MLRYYLVHFEESPYTDCFIGISCTLGVFFFNITRTQGILFSAIVSVVSRIL